MSTVSPPSPREPFFDSRSGEISRVWLRFFSDVFNRIGGSEQQDLTAIVSLLNQAIADIRELESQYTPEPVGIGDALRAVEELRNELESTRRTVDEQRGEIEALRAQLEQGNAHDLVQRIETIEGRLG